MRRFTAAAALLLSLFAFVNAQAEAHLARYGVQYVVPFKLYNADGTLDVDEADGGTEVSVRCQGGTNATATNDFVDRGSDYEVTLTATEMQCATVIVTIAATTTEVTYINTVNNASAAIPTLEANVATITDGAIVAADFATGAITATVIAADAIGASELAADAIGASEIAADFSTELLTGLANLSVNVAQVSGDSAAADNIETAYDDTAGAVRWHNIVDQGTAQAATATTLQLRSAAAFADDEIIGATVVISTATAGAGQARTITDYVQSTDTATVANWTTTPSGTITYRVLGVPPGSGGSVSIAAGGITASSFAAGAIDASAIAADAIGSSEIATDAIGTNEIAADAIGAAELANGAIDAATFAAGAIDATAIATDAITSAEIAANAIGAAEVADGTIDEATFSTTAGSFDALGIIDQGTAQAATGTTLQLRSAAAFADDEIIGATCLITGGSAGIGQARTITDYVSSTDTATVATWTTTPTGTITYECFGTAAGGGTVSIAAGGITASSFASGAIDAAAIAADAIGASEIATDAITAAELAADAIGASELAANAIGSSELADGGITSAEFGTGAITATVIATDAIGAAELAADAIGAAEIANASIDAATFAAGAIDASAIATDAIGAAEVAADVSTELLTGLANLSVNVGQISGDSGAADELELAFDGTTGAVEALGILRQGTAQSATGTTLVMDTGAAFADDAAIGMTVVACGSTQGYCQARGVTDNANASDTLTVETWTVTPSGTITYYLFGTAPSTGGGGGLDAAGVRAAVGLASANLDTQLGGIQTDTNAIEVDTQDIQARLPAALVSGRIDASVGAMATGVVTATAIASDAIGSAEIATGAIDADAIAADAIGASELATDAIGAAEIAADAITAAELAANVGADLTSIPWNAAWDPEVQSEAADALAAIFLDQLLATAYDPASPPGAADSLLEDLVENDAGVTRFNTNALENGPAGGGGSSDWSVGEREQIRHRLGIDGTAAAPSATPSLASASQATAIETDTQDIQGRLPAALLSGRMDASVGAMASNVMTAAAAASDLTTELQSGLATSSALAAVDDFVDEVETRLGVAGAGLTAVPWNAAWDAEVQSEVADALAAIVLIEPAAVPTWGSSTAWQWLAYFAAWSRNEINQTSTTKTLRNDADSSNIASCTVSDDGTTFTVAECQ